MAPSMSTHRSRRTGLVPLALVAAAASSALLPGALFGASDAQAFSPTSGGMSRKQAKSQLHTRGNLKRQVLEIPLDEQVDAEAQLAEQPERRLPYTIHMVSQLANHRHLAEDGPTRKYLQKKLVGAVDHMEDMIKHVEVQVKVEENFHKEKDGHKKVVQPDISAVEMSNGEVVEDIRNDAHDQGAKVLAPFQIKVVVSMRNGREVVYSNPSKHAETSLTEATDGMADGLRRLLREEKEKEISARRHAKDSDSVELDAFEEEAIDTIGAAEDAEAEALYKEIEATGDEK